jgi:hypothetical protein
MRSTTLGRRRRPRGSLALDHSKPRFELDDHSIRGIESRLLRRRHRLDIDRCGWHPLCDMNHFCSP